MRFQYLCENIFFGKKESLPNSPITGLVFTDFTTGISTPRRRRAGIVEEMSDLYMKTDSEQCVVYRLHVLQSYISVLFL